MPASTVKKSEVSPNKGLPSPISGRKIKYKKVLVEIFFLKDRNPLNENNPLTYDIAAEFLGLRTDTETVKLGDNYLCKIHGVGKILCENNDNNRPFSKDWMESLAQDILQKNWKRNLENIIIGETGRVISGQHRLVGLLHAVQIWRDPELGKYYRKEWPEEPYIETIVACGCEEDEATIRTIDNVKTRTLADVFFTSGFFAKENTQDRETLSKITQYTVQFLWKRTGASNDPNNSHLTHSEAVEFVRNHPKVLKCVNHIFTEAKKTSKNKEKLGDGISRYISPGLAAGLTYLMAACNSDGEAYRKKAARGTANEKNLDFSALDKALEFWSGLCLEHWEPDSTPFKHVKNARRSVIGDKKEESGFVFGKGGGSRNEGIAVLCKAWFEFLNGGALTPKNLKLLVELDWDESGGHKTIADVTLKDADRNCCFGGIDAPEPERGNAVEDLEDEAEEEGTIPASDDVPEETPAPKVKSKTTDVDANGNYVGSDEDAPTPEQIKERSQKVKQQSKDQTKDASNKSTIPVKSPTIAPTASKGQGGPEVAGGGDRPAAKTPEQGNSGTVPKKIDLRPKKLQSS